MGRLVPTQIQYESALVANCITLEAPGNKTGKWVEFLLVFSLWN